MSSKGLQSFSSGLFLATAIFGGIYYLSYEEEMTTSIQQTEVNVSSSLSTMKQELEEDGFFVLTEEEMEQKLAESDTLQKNASPDLQTEEEPRIIYTMLLQISAGMTSNEVADQLVRGQIIEDRSVFLDYVETNQLTQSLRIGEYKLQSDMNMEEIIDQLT